MPHVNAHSSTEIASTEIADVRHDCGVDEVVALHDLPLLELISRANAASPLS
jgi:hypothetical protein